MKPYRPARVVGYGCDHGYAVPMQGVSLAGEPWYGHFCTAGTCLPAWRNPQDPLLVWRGKAVSGDETSRRMASVARSGVLHGAWQ
jgi:hypothetical protein